MVQSQQVSPGILRYESILSPAKCRELIEKFEKEKIKVVEKPIKDESKGVGNYRDCSTVFINQLPGWQEEKKALIEAIRPYVLDYNARFGITNSFQDTGFEFVKYEPGHVCQMHRDGGMNQLSIFGSMVLFLNTLMESGQLVYPEQGAKVFPVVGSATFFPASFVYPHYTEPSDEARYVIVTFFRYTKGRL